MAYNDEWCDFCNDRMKEVSVSHKDTGREHDVCKWCASLSVNYVICTEEARDYA